MTISTEQIHALRVKWDKGRNMLKSFFYDLEEVRRDIGEEGFARWCIMDLGIGVTLIQRMTVALGDVERKQAQEDLSKAMAKEQADKKAKADKERAERDVLKAKADEERAARGRAKAAKAAEDKRAEERKAAEHQSKLAAIAADKAKADAEKAKAERRARDNETGTGRGKVESAKRTAREVIKRPPVNEVTREEKFSFEIKKAIGLKRSAEALNGKARQDWIGAVILISDLLYAARQTYPSNQAFGEWYDAQAFDLGKNERASLIMLAEDYGNQRRDIFENTESWSVQLIGRDVAKLRLVKA